MKIFLLLFSFAFIAPACQAQKKTKRLKYEFQDYRNNSTRKLKSGKFVTVELKTNDTLHIYSGTFLRLESDSLFIDLTDEVFTSDTDDFEESFKLQRTFSNQTIGVYIDDIEKIVYTTFLKNVGITLSGLGSVGIFFGPLGALDKKADQGFNTKRYKHIISYSALTLVAGQCMILGGMVELKVP